MGLYGRSKQQEPLRHTPHVRKGDTVVVLSGKDAGKQGRVLRVNATKGTAIVERVNFTKKHTRPNPGKNVKGGILERESPIKVDKLQVIEGEADTKNDMPLESLAIVLTKRHRVFMAAGLNQESRNMLHLAPIQRRRRRHRTTRRAAGRSTPTSRRSECRQPRIRSLREALHAAAVATAEATCSGSVTSAGANAPPSSAATSAPADAGRSRIVTEAPAAASRRAVARPMPLAPPVTSTRSRGSRST